MDTIIYTSLVWYIMGMLPTLAFLESHWSNRFWWSKTEKFIVSCFILLCWPIVFFGTSVTLLFERKEK